MNKLSVNVIDCGFSSFDVMFDGVNFGCIDKLDPEGDYIYYPKLQHRMTGSHYILIGRKLNELNSNECIDND